MASKFCESSHSRRRGLPTPSHIHLAKSRQGRFKRKTGDVCLVIGVKGDAMGRPTTRAKALNSDSEPFRGFENPLPRTEVRGWHNSYLLQTWRCKCTNSRPRTKSWVLVVDMSESPQGRLILSIDLVDWMRGRMRGRNNHRTNAAKSGSENCV